MFNKTPKTGVRVVPGICGAVLSASLVLANPDDSGWNQFRGPNSSGAARTSRPPVKIEAGIAVWKTSLPSGQSSPVVSRNRIFLTALDGDRLVTLAFDATSGKQVWRQEAPKVSLEKVHAISSPSSSTPFVDDARVHVYFGSYGLLCYDLAGREQWRKPIATPKSLYGMATSPIGHGGNLILVLDNDANIPDSKLSQSKVISVRKSTGEIVWEAARPFARSSWSTPSIWHHDGGDELVVLGSGRLSSYDPDTGAEKWFSTGFSRETIAQPVSGGGLLFASAAMLGGVADEQPDREPFWKAMLQFDSNGDSKIGRAEITEHFTFPLRPELPPEHPGFGIPLPTDEAARRKRQGDAFGGMDKDKDGFVTRDEFFAHLNFDRGKPRLVAIRPGGSGELSDKQFAWQVNRNIPEIPSPLFHQDRLYLVRSGGLLSCVNATDGKLLYTERLNAPGQYSASPVVANDHLYLISNLGVISVVKTGDTFQLVHQHDLKESAAATPAIVGNRIYVRTAAHLYAFGD